MEKLDYYKYVLRQVAFEEDLFQKELLKCISTLFHKEKEQFRSWCLAKFKNYAAVINEAFGNDASSYIDEEAIKDLCYAGFQLHDAFIQGSEEKIKKESTESLIAISDILSQTKNEESSESYILSKVREGLILVNSKNDLSVKLKSYSNSSIYLYKFLKVVGMPEKLKVYYQYCPVSLNKHGAFWISDSERIINPYALVEPFHCGRVIGKTP